MSIKIICGFAGAGKSSIKANPKYAHLKIIDLDSGAYTKHPSFPDNYLNALKSLSKSTSHHDAYVLISTHKNLLDRLLEAELKHAVVMPHQDLSYKEWEKRYLDRPNPPGFMDIMETNYDSFISDMLLHDREDDALAVQTDQPKLCRLYQLKDEEYLSDVFDDIIGYFEPMSE